MKKFSVYIIISTLNIFALCGCDPTGEEKIIPISKIGNVQKIPDAYGYYVSNSSTLPQDPKTEVTLGDIPTDPYTGDYDDGSAAIDYNPDKTVIQKFKWDDFAVSIDEVPNYPYGFDKLPSDEDHVYVSVADGENASISMKLSTEAYSRYFLKNDVTGLDYDVVNGTNTIASAGDYTLYGQADAHSTPVSLNKHLKVLSYPIKYKDIYFVPLNYGFEADKDLYAFTKDRVKTNFDDVYSQVVMYANVIERDPSFYDNGTSTIDLSKIIQINMFHPESRILSEMIDYAFSRAASDIPSGTLAKDLDVSKIKERHVVFTINKERKYWSLESVYGGDGSLNWLPGLNPYGAVNPKYAIQSMGTCEDGVGPNPIPVTIRQISGQLYAYSNGVKAKFGPCDILYTDDELPIVPSNSGAYAFSCTMGYNGFVYGSVIVFPRATSQSSAYSLLHELGHSFGLTDVVQNNKDEAGQPTTETNVMSWIVPSGRKLRYHGANVAYTSGGPWHRECPVRKDDKTLVYQNQWACLRGDCDTYDYWTNVNPVYRFWTGLDLKGENPVTAKYEDFCLN